MDSILSQTARRFVEREYITSEGHENKMEGSGHIERECGCAKGGVKGVERVKEKQGENPEILFYRTRRNNRT